MEVCGIPINWQDVHVTHGRNTHEAFCIRIVLHRETIALQIKTLRIDARTTSHDLREEYPAHMERDICNDAALNCLSDRLNDIPFRNNDLRREQWREKVFEWDTSFLIPIALVQLTNIESLRMTDMLDDNKTFWLPTLELVTNMLGDSHLPVQQRPFQKLRRVFIDNPTDGGDTSPHAVAVAARLPKVETIHAVRTMDIEKDKLVDELFDSLTPRSLNLRTVNLLPNCKLTGKHLQQLLATSSNLHTLRYHVGNNGRTTFRTAELQAALEQHKDSLEKVELSIDETELESTGETTPQLLSMRFETFSRLKQVCVSIPFIFDIRFATREHASLVHIVRILPQSLQLLRIVGVDSKAQIDWLERNLSYLVGRKSMGVFPSLTEVHVSARIDQDDPNVNIDMARFSLVKIFAGSSIKIYPFRETSSFSCFRRPANEWGKEQLRDEVAHCVDVDGDDNDSGGEFDSGPDDGESDDGTRGYGILNRATHPDDRIRRTVEKSAFTY